MSNLSEERFSRFAGRYVDSQTHAHGDDLYRLVEIAAPQPGWLALDVATGGGHTGAQVALKGARVIASDLTYAMLLAARGHVTRKGLEGIAFCACASENLAFPGETFDLITCRIAAHHFLDLPAFMAGCWRTLKRGGALVLQDQALPEGEEDARQVNEFERLRDPSHQRAYSGSQWVAHFEAAGLAVEHAEFYMKKHHFHTWAGRQDCSPETVRELEQMALRLNPGAREWMQPEGFPGPDATFYNQHILLRGRKA